MEKKVNELKVGSILTYVNLFLSCIIPLLYTPVMLRILGQAEYGLYSLSNSVISYLSLLTFGMGSAVVRYITKGRVTGSKDDVRGILGLFTSIYTIFALLVCLVGGVLIIGAATFFGNGLTVPEIFKFRILLFIMILSTAFSFLASVFAAVVIAYEKYIFRKVFECITTILGPIFNLIVLFAGHATIGMALVGLVTQISTLLIFVIYCKKELDLYPDFKNKPQYVMKEIWGFSAVIFLSSLIDLLYWSTDKVLIGGMIGTVAVAVYNVGGTFTTMLQNLSSAISGVFGTRVTAMVFEKRPMEEFSELLIRIGRIQYLVVSLVFSGYVVFGPSFLYFWAGEKYEEAYGIGLVTMLPLAVPSIQSIAYSTIVAQNKHRFRAVVYAIVAVINLVSTIWAIPRFGIMGAAVCTGVAFLVGNGVILNIYYYKKIGLDIPSFWKNIIKLSVIPAMLATLSIFCIRKFLPINTVYQFAIGVIIYTMVFGILSWRFSMNHYEKELIRSLLKGLIYKK